MQAAIITHDESETRRAAAELARVAPRNAFFALDGDLGAGKTCFVQGLAAAIGVRDAVASPTFAIANENVGADGRRLAHLDLYRLSGPQDLDSIGWEDYLDSGAMMAVEWPDRAGDEIPRDAIRVSIRNLPDSPDAREISWQGPDSATGAGVRVDAGADADTNTGAGVDAGSVAEAEPELLQAGRNVTTREMFRMPDGATVDAVVKRFAAPSRFRVFINRVRRVPGKAERSFKAAEFLNARAPGSTAEPLFFDESTFVSRHVAGIASFKDKLLGIYARRGTCAELMALLETVAEALAKIHDAGFVHNDLGNQNIFIRPDGDAPRVALLDLNRSRMFRGPAPTWARARDLSRISLPSDFLRVFFEMYWRGAHPPPSFLGAERRARARFALHTATRRLRHPLREWRLRADDGAAQGAGEGAADGASGANGASAANGENGAYPEPRDVWVWDDKSEQPAVAFRSEERRRLQSASRVTAPLFALAKLALAARGNMRHNKALSFARPRMLVAGRVFVSISAGRARLENELLYLEKLGCLGAHVRFCAHEGEGGAAFKIDAVRRLRAAGKLVAISIAQDRDTAKNPAAFGAFCRRVLSELRGQVVWAELLHAVNRVKWGVWSFAELDALLEVAARLAEEFPDVEFTGPQVIDFEWDYFAAAQMRLPPRLLSSTVSAAMYVDRRGAPENRQGKHDALAKLQAFRSIAEARRAQGGGAARPKVRLVVSEFNWPLKGTAEWSPVGCPYVSPSERDKPQGFSELDAAAFTLRYLLIGICSGMADQMVFWSLAAHGFGLVDCGTAGSSAGGTDASAPDAAEPEAPWRPRPAFHALAAFFSLLRRAHYIRALAAGEKGVWALLFTAESGRHIIAAWNSSGKKVKFKNAFEIKFAPSRYVDFLGADAPEPTELDGRPVYIIQ